MGYHIDAEEISLDDLLKRLEETDLVPGRASLLDGIESKFKALEQQGIITLADLRKELKNSKRLEAVATLTGLDTNYLVLLRREIESFFPKPIALKALDWLPQGEIARLEEYGLRDTAAVYEAASRSKNLSDLAKKTGLDVAMLEKFVQLADLTRVQWVSPTVARMLVEADYDSAFIVAAADAGDLCDSLMRVNAGGRFFKGKIGLRDIKRLIRAAGHVPN